MFEFIVWCTITTEHSINAVKGKHWRNTDKIKNLVHDQVVWQVKTHSMFKNPVRITLSYNSNLDLDNHAFLRKYIIDAMKGYLIKDDKRKYVVRIVEEFWDGSGIKVQVEEI